MSRWRIGVSMPSFYPVKVSRAYGVNEDQDWIALVHHFSQNMRRNEHDYVQRGFEEY